MTSICRKHMSFTGCRWTEYGAESEVMAPECSLEWTERHSVRWGSVVCVFFCVSLYLCPSVSVISAGRDIDAALPRRLGLGCCPELSFSTSSLSHTHRVIPAHTFSPARTDTHMHSYTCLRILSCGHRDTKHTEHRHTPFVTFDCGGGA